ncbi:hypothetical protein [Primorskyibacter sp. 2E233]|uniref:hypothetical protein n=1 Tax=Primorskyibacter sp. 2E233 TaxID=3413431 RepID=UPI003BF33F62
MMLLGGAHRGRFENRPDLAIGRGNAELGLGYVIRRKRQGFVWQVLRKAWEPFDKGRVQVFPSAVIAKRTAKQIARIRRGIQQFAVVPKQKDGFLGSPIDNRFKFGGPCAAQDQPSSQNHRDSDKDSNAYGNEVLHLKFPVLVATANIHLSKK